MDNIETLTLKQICSYVAIVNKMEQEGIIKVDIDKTYVEFDYDETLKYLEKQNVKLNNIITELETDIYFELSKTREDNDYNEGLINAFKYIKNQLKVYKELKEGK